MICTQVEDDLSEGRHRSEQQAVGSGAAVGDDHDGRGPKEPDETSHLRFLHPLQLRALSAHVLAAFGDEDVGKSVDEVVPPRPHAFS